MTILTASIPAPHNVSSSSPVDISALEDLVVCEQETSWVGTLNVEFSDSSSGPWYLALTVTPSGSMTNIYKIKGQTFTSAVKPDGTTGKTTVDMTRARYARIRTSAYTTGSSLFTFAGKSSTALLPMIDVAAPQTSSVVSDPVYIGDLEDIIIFDRYTSWQGKTRIEFSYDGDLNGLWFDIIDWDLSGAPVTGPTMYKPKGQVFVGTFGTSTVDIPRVPYVRVRTTQYIGGSAVYGFIGRAR